MTVARSSYLKTFYLAAGGTIAAIATAELIEYAGLGVLATPLVVAGLIASAAFAIVAASGLLVLYRDKRMAAGAPDLFLSLNRSRSEPVLASLPRATRFSWRRFLAPQSYAVGDMVEVRSWEEIQRTLDDSGALAGVPFMTEMLPYCGQRARVLRGVDKVYDYGGSKTLRRLKNCVLLVGFRCNGADHGGCQARCSMFWNTAWLKPARGEAPPKLAGVLVAASAKKPASSTQQDRFVCQYTQVAAASTPMSDWDIRQELRPLFAGNVTVAAFVVALMTRLFNSVQGLRGGVPFPHVTNGGQSRTPVEAKNFAESEPVRVLGTKEIGETLDATFRNRGLWFDREMTKHCHQKYPVALRVDRIIDDVTGRMVPMKTPCILLDDVVASGEFLRFCAQQEYLFWREMWLTKESPQSIEKGN